MTLTQGVDDALNIFLSELSSTVRAQREHQDEVNRARIRRDKLTRATVSAIDTLPVRKRETQLKRLRAIIGTDDPILHGSRESRRTDRIRVTLEWMRDNARPTFTSADLRRHLGRLGHQNQSGYVGTLLGRLCEQGILTRVGYGRYRVNREHQEFARV